MPSGAFASALGHELPMLDLAAPLMLPPQGGDQFFASSSISSWPCSATMFAAHTQAQTNASYCGSVRYLLAASFEYGTGFAVPVLDAAPVEQRCVANRECR